MRRLGGVRKDKVCRYVIPFEAIGGRKGESRFIHINSHERSAAVEDDDLRARTV